MKKNSTRRGSGNRKTWNEVKILAVDTERWKHFIAGLCFSGNDKNEVGRIAQHVRKVEGKN